MRSPGWGKGRPEGGLYWTRERVVAGLRDFARRNHGPLPTSSRDYHALKRGHLEWPGAERVLFYFGSIAGGWAAAGVNRKRWRRGWVDWTQEEDDYLLEHAGEQTLITIARHLNRSWPACKRRLYDLGSPARANSGYLSALEVSREYGVAKDTVLSWIAAGRLRAHRIFGSRPGPHAGYWRIDPADVDRALEPRL